MYDGKFLEIPLSENLQQLGFTKVSLFGKNIVVGIQGRNPLVSTFRKDEWERTARSLEKMLVVEGIERKSARQLIVFLTRVLKVYRG
jgi:hypothetical protein